MDSEGDSMLHMGRIKTGRLATAIHDAIIIFSDKPTDFPSDFSHHKIRVHVCMNWCLDAFPFHGEI